MNAPAGVSMTHSMMTDTATDVADVGDWIVWEGGDCPVPADTMVEYQMDNPPATDTDVAWKLDWRTRAPYLAIKAYRVVPEAAQASRQKQQKDGAR